MFGHANELELLDLIEGELDATAEAALRIRLQDQPGALETLQRMQADRAALRSTPQPALPMNFLAAVEPFLARPMLIETPAHVEHSKPGEFRRLHRRRARRIRWRRLALAAAIACGVLGAVWAAIVQFSNLTTPLATGPNQLAESNGDQATAAAAGTNQPLAADRQPNINSNVIAAGNSIHHYQPTAMPPELAFGSPTQPGIRAAGVDADTSAAGSRIVAADVAIVVSVRDVSAAEQELAQRVTSLGESAALVRNFSFEQAKKLEEQWRLAHAGATRGDDEPVIADVKPRSAATPRSSSQHMQRLAQRVREQLAHNGASMQPATSAAENAPLAGPKNLAPALEQQLDFSSRGAAYTIAVRASDLAELLQELGTGHWASGSRMPQQGVILRMMPAGANSSTPEALPNSVAWFTQAPRVRQAIGQLQQNPSAIVLLPVIVQR
jgi:hypothetical protein